jgi:WD40 repeat protein
MKRLFLVLSFVTSVNLFCMDVSGTSIEQIVPVETFDGQRLDVSRTILNRFNALRETLDVSDASEGLTLLHPALTVENFSDLVELSEKEEEAEVLAYLRDPKREARLIELAVGADYLDFNAPEIVQVISENIASFEAKALLDLPEDIQNLIKDRWVNNLNNLEKVCPNELAQNVRFFGKVASGGDGSKVAFNNSNYRLESQIEIWNLLEWNGRARTFHLADRIEIPDYFAREYIIAMALSKNGSKVAIGSRNGEVRIWNLNQNGKALSDIPTIIDRSNGLRGKVSKIALSENGERMITTSNYNEVRVWNLDRNGKLLDDGAADTLKIELTHSLDMISSLDISEDGKRVVIGLRSGPVKILNLDESGRVVGSPYDLPRTPISLVNSVAISKDNRSVTVGGADGMVRVWRLDEDGGVVELFFLMNGPYHSEILSVGFGESGNKVVAGLVNGRTYIWDLDEEALSLEGYKMINKPDIILGEEGDAGIVLVKFSDGDNKLLTVSRDGSSWGILKMWRLGSSQEECKNTVTLPIICAIEKEQLSDEEKELLQNEIDFDEVFISEIADYLIRKLGVEPRQFPGDREDI